MSGIVKVVLVVGWEIVQGRGKWKRESHAYLAIPACWARDLCEPFIVQRWSSGNKRWPLCCCHWWSIVAGESLSAVPFHREGTPLCRSTAGVCPSNSGEELNIALSIWTFHCSGLPAMRDVGECLYCFCSWSKANAPYRLGAVSMTQGHFSPIWWELHDKT